MYCPPAFREEEPEALCAALADAHIATLVTATADGIIGTPLPLFLDRSEGEHGTLYGHLARANPQWQRQPIGEAMAIFSGADAYITPSWYATKRETGKVVPTWNYLAVHAYGPVTFFEDPDRLLAVVARLTRLHEDKRNSPWQVADAPAPFVKAQLRGIVGMRMPITRIEGKRKMSQNRCLADRIGVAEGLADSEELHNHAVAALVPQGQ